MLQSRWTTQALAYLLCLVFTVSPTGASEPNADFSGEYRLVKSHGPAKEPAGERAVVIEQTEKVVIIKYVWTPPGKETSVLPYAYMLDGTVSLNVDAGGHEVRSKVKLKGRKFSVESTRTNGQRNFMEWLLSKDGQTLEFQEKAILPVLPGTVIPIDRCTYKRVSPQGQVNSPAS
jgi:hypothetical protein